MTDWSDIVRQHGPLVWRTARRLLSHEADARDCFQETFVSAWELSCRESIRHWPAVLKRLTTARALERLRQRYRFRDRSEPWPETPLQDERAPDPTQSVADGELAEQLRLALSDLDQQQAEVFCLSVFEGLAYREIASATGHSVSHVGVLLHRARKRLQDLMETYRPVIQGRPNPSRKCEDPS